MNAQLQTRIARERRGSYEALWNRTANDRLKHGKVILQRDAWAIFCIVLAIGYVIQFINYYWNLINV